MSAFSRREFLFGVGALVIAGCAPKTEQKPIQPTRQPALQPQTVEWPRNEDIKARLINEVNLLPPSTIKSQLQSRVLRYLQQKPPFTLDFAGVNHEVASVGINYKYSPIGNSTAGSFTPIIDGMEQSYQVTKGQDFYLPLLFGISDQEKDLFPQNRLLPDKTPLFNVTFDQGKDIFVGLAPSLVISRSTNLPPANLAELYQMERFGLIKEACGWLLHDVLLEESIRKMQSAGLYSKIQVKNRKSGDIEDVDVTTRLIKVAMNQEGRSIALLDLAGYLLAFRAVENTPYYNLLLKRPNFKAAIEQSKGFDYGSDAPSILYRATREVFTAPALASVHYVGDISKVP